MARRRKYQEGPYQPRREVGFDVPEDDAIDKRERLAATQQRMRERMSAEKRAEMDRRQVAVALTAGARRRPAAAEPTGGPAPKPKPPVREIRVRRRKLHAVRKPGT